MGYARPMYIADRETGFPALINGMNLEVGIEIGVRHGTYSKLLLENSNIKLLYGLDSFPYSDMLPATKDNLSRFGTRSQIIKGFTPDESNNFNDDFFDFIYIDANHTFEAVYDDLVAWWPKLKMGGLFAGDDYTYLTNPGEGKYGVVPAVDGFAEIRKQKVFVTGVSVDSIKEKHRIARGSGKIIEYGLNHPGTFTFGTSTLEDDIRIPNWYIFKEE